MLDPFRQRLTALNCANGRLLVAVSGGLDSVVLVHLLRHSKAVFAIAHMNFQLRGDDSNADEAFVQALSLEIGVPFFSRRVETNNYAMNQGFSIQMAARKLRYDWFNELVTTHRYDAVLTAHHRNDALETALINFVRGTGVNGLTGIPERNGYVLRPMLAFDRASIEQYARENALQWREDASNISDDYQRNFIRHNIIPKLKELNPSLEETFARTAARLVSAAALMDASIARLKEKYVVEENGRVTIRKTLFDEASSPAPLLYELISEYDFNYAQCESIVAALQGQPGKVFSSHRSRLFIDRETIIIVPAPEPTQAMVIASADQRVTHGNWMLSFHPTTSLEIPADPLIVSVDAAKLVFPLTLRSWKAGDYFYPFGMAHRKKLSDFMSGLKLSGADKQNVTILESDGKIVWVVGYRLDNRFGITEGTRQVVEIRAEEWA